MNEIFRELILTGKVIIYLDDILIFTETKEEHRILTKQVLEILRKNKLTCKPEKCEFEKDKIEYLGYIISHGRVEMDMGKVDAITQWPNPRNKKELQSFLGFTNFYRKFIMGYSHIVKPLTNLTGNTEWQWEQTEQDCFDKLKEMFTRAPILTTPNDEDPYRIDADASNFAIGGCLMQKQDNQWKPVAYLSKALQAAEKNYEIYDRELLAIMRCLDEW
ncbi:marY1-like reverse transcriptase, partial [Wolfiporia cocos MD-104 SS10]